MGTATVGGHRRSARVHLEGTHNTRDLGGLRAGERTITPGRFLRSDALDRITDRDADRLRAMGVTTVIDLRTPDEIPAGDPPGARFGAATLRIPVLARNWNPSDHQHWLSLPHDLFLADRYCEMFVNGVGALVEALEAVVADAGPVIVHCAVGKDRTGVLVALALSLIGVGDRDIARDYSASEEPVARLVAALRAIRTAEGRTPHDDPPIPVPGAYFAAPINAIRLFLDVARGAPRDLAAVLVDHGADASLPRRLADWATTE